MTEIKPEVEKFLAEFRKLPDWEHYPLPEICYTKYGVPRPKVNNDLQTALMAQLTPPPSQFLGMETREKAPGGVREIQLPELPEVIIEPVKEKTDDEHPPETQPPSAGAKESTETKSQGSELHF